MPSKHSPCSHAQIVIFSGGDEFVEGAVGRDLPPVNRRRAWKRCPIHPAVRAAPDLAIVNCRQEICEVRAGSDSSPGFTPRTRKRGPRAAPICRQPDILIIHYSRNLRAIRITRDSSPVLASCNCEGRPAHTTISRLVDISIRDSSDHGPEVGRRSYSYPVSTGGAVRDGLTRIRPRRNNGAGGAVTLVVARDTLAHQRQTRLVGACAIARGCAASPESRQAATLDQIAVM